MFDGRLCTICALKEGVRKKMTEQTLERGIEIKRQIDELRNRKNKLTLNQSLCYGSREEMQEKNFMVEITERSKVHRVNLSPESIKLALDNELMQTEEILKNYLDDLEELK